MTTYSRVRGRLSLPFAALAWSIFVCGSSYAAWAGARPQTASSRASACGSARPAHLKGTRPRRRERPARLHSRHEPLAFSRPVPRASRCHRAAAMGRRCRVQGGRQDVQRRGDERGCHARVLVQMRRGDVRRSVRAERADPGAVPWPVPNGWRRKTGMLSRMPNLRVLIPQAYEMVKAKLPRAAQAALVASPPGRAATRAARSPRRAKR